MMRTIAPAKDRRKKAGAEFHYPAQTMREENPKGWCLPQSRERGNAHGKGKNYSSGAIALARCGCFFTGRHLSPDAGRDALSC